MTRIVAILDYGMGNLRSVEKALERVGAEAEITTDPERAAGRPTASSCPASAPSRRRWSACASTGLDELVAERIERGPAGARASASACSCCSSPRPRTRAPRARPAGGPVGPLAANGLQGPAHRLVAGALGARSRADRGAGRRAALLLRPLLRARGRRTRTTCSAPPPTASASPARSSARRSTAPSSTPRSRARRACACSRTSPRICASAGSRLILYPAIDIRDGRAVRLLQGDYDRETAYDDDPVDRRPALGGRGRDAGCTSSTSTAPAPASRSTSTTSGADRRRGRRSRSSSAAGCATRRRSRRRSRPGSSAWCWAPPRSATPRSPRRSPPPTATGWSPPSTPGAARSRPRAGPSLRGRRARPSWPPSSPSAGSSASSTPRSRWTGLMEGPDIDSLREVAGATDAELIYSGGVGSLEDLQRAGGAGDRQPRRRDRRPRALRGALRRRRGPGGPGRIDGCIRRACSVRKLFGPFFVFAGVDALRASPAGTSGSCRRTSRATASWSYASGVAEIAGGLATMHPATRRAGQPLEHRDADRGLPRQPPHGAQRRRVRGARPGRRAGAVGSPARAGAVHRLGLRGGRMGRRALAGGAALAALVAVALVALLGGDGGETSDRDRRLRRERASPRRRQPGSRPPSRPSTRAGRCPTTRTATPSRTARGCCPTSPQGYYREYTVETPGSDDRGARRLVIGSQGETYYTRDHYESFIRIDPEDYT